MYLAKNLLIIVPLNGCFHSFKYNQVTIIQINKEEWGKFVEQLDNELYKQKCVK